MSKSYVAGILIPNRIDAIMGAVTQRRELRLETDQRVRVTSVGAPDAAMVCRIVDASRSGFCLVLKQPVSLGSELRVQWGQHSVVGRVRHIRMRGDRYYAGLQNEMGAATLERRPTVLESEI